MKNKENIPEAQRLAQRLENARKEMENKKSTTTNSIIIDESTKDSPKLFVHGRLNRKSNTYVSRSLILLDYIAEDIKKYCRGNELAVLNYVVQVGLNHIKQSENPIYINIADLEANKPK